VCSVSVSSSSLADSSFGCENKYWYLYLKVGYKDMIGTVGPVLIVGKRRTVLLLV
jgi:hypothetical protein